MTNDFDVIEWWDKQFPDSKILKNKSKIEPILHFSLMWNYFEYSFAPDYKKSIGGRLKELGKKSFPVIDNDEIYQDTWTFFKGRYLDKKKITKDFYKLRLSNNNKKFVENCLLNKKTDGDNIAALLMIIYRFRNNLFHGGKNPKKLTIYKEAFEVINRFLAEYIGEMNGKIRVDKDEYIVDGNGVKIGE